MSNPYRNKKTHATMAASAGITLHYPVEEDYEVEAILDHDEPTPGKRIYLIKWKTYDDSWNTWEPEQSLDNCPDILAEYKAKAGIPADPVASDAEDEEDGDTEELDEEEDEDEEEDLRRSKGRCKRTPAKQKRKKSSGGGSGGKKSASASSSSSKRSGGSKRKERKRKHSQDREVTSVAKRQTATATATQAEPSIAPEAPAPEQPQGDDFPSKRPSARILELIEDGAGELLVSVKRPGSVDPLYLRYTDAKERHPLLVIDFFEAHLTFDKKVIQEYVLVPPPATPVGGASA